MVKRYNLGMPGDSTAIAQADDGFLVHYTDYAALEAECARLRQELSKRPLGVDEDPLTGKLR